ncbi:MAG: hypothetical protein ACYS83_00800 [Planctomycetota bacterium]
MDETNLENKLNELVKEFGSGADPRYRKLAMLAKQARESHKQLQKSVDGLQESLDYLRICGLSANMYQVSALRP